MALDNSKLKKLRMQNMSALTDSAAKLDRNLDSLFSALGKAYYESENASVPADLGDLFDSIRKCEADSARIKEQITWLRYTMTCKNCGAELREGTAFCTACGTRIDRELPDHLIGTMCPGCGSPLAENAAFCVKCGTSARGQAVKPEAPASEEQPAAEEPSPFCPGCGKPLRPGAKFCSGCGRPV